jgi:RNA polymerase sigma-70 factor (ECF subfamily)
MGELETVMGGSCDSFKTTRWTVLEPGQEGELVRIYWRPVYIHLRRKGHSIEDAKDLTQDFFSSFLEKDSAQQADPTRGKFRNFLRVSVDRFAADAKDRARAQKRGGGKVFSLDVEGAEAVLSGEGDPERDFDRQWARAIVEDSMRALEREFEAKGQAEKFAALRPALVSGTCEDRVALHRARKRFGELVRERVARTVGSAAEAEEELTVHIESL